MNADTIAGGKRPVDTITVAASIIEMHARGIQRDIADIPASDIAADARIFRKQADELEYAAVIIARQDGQSWDFIGTMLGISRQAAHKAYAHRLPATLA